MRSIALSLLLALLSMGAAAQPKCHVRIMLLAVSPAEIERTSPEIRDKTCVDAIAGSALRFDDQSRPVAWFRQGVVTWGKEGDQDVMEIKNLEGVFRYVGKSSPRADGFSFEGVDNALKAIGKIEVSKTADGKVGEFLYSYTARRFGLVHYKPGD